MTDLHDQMDTLRRFMASVYREMPELRGELQLVVLTDVGEQFIHPDKKAAAAFARKSQRFHQSTAMQSLWEDVRDVCTKYHTSLYCPSLDTIVVNLRSDPKTNGEFALDWVLRHELGHALDRLNLDASTRNTQLAEMTADAFATLYTLRDNPKDTAAIDEAIRLRSWGIRRSLRGDFNTRAAIRDAVTIANTNDITGLPLAALIAIAQDTAAKACPVPLTYERDKAGRFLKNPHLAARRA